MAQVLPPNCPRCGVPTVPGQRFCANCGLSSEAMQASGGYLPAASSQSSPFQPPRASLPRSTTLRPLSRTGCILVLLALLIVLGTASYIATAFLGFRIPGLGAPVSQPPITTTSVNEAVTYKGVIITVLNAQQSQRFLDDPNTATDGMLRLNLQEQNKTGIPVSLNYYDNARLILPTKASIMPTFVKARTPLAPGATQTSIVDFAVSTDDKISQTTLQLGTAGEAQMNIPLTGKANLSRYQSTTTHLNNQLQYFGLNWTITTATTTLSIPGQQASRGMRYLVLTLKVDNTLSQTAIAGSPYDYVRLKFGSSTASPKNSTLPVSFAAGETGKTGTVTFLVPQNTTAFTLLLEPQSHNPNEQASADFQLA